MTAPVNAHPKCPRATSEHSGPRRCVYTSSCALHLAHRDNPHRSAPRRALARELADTCAVDLAERARSAGAVLTFAEIGAVLGTDAPAVLRTYRRAVLKVRLRVLTDGR